MFISQYILVILNASIVIYLMNQKRQKDLEIGHSPEEIRNALSYKRLGGSCLINFCGSGETLLSTEIVAITKELLEEGHYVSIVTNGTITKAIDEMCKWDNKLLRHLFLKFSFRFMELKEKQIFDIFFNNFNSARDREISVSMELMPCDDLIPYIDEIKEISLKSVGALPHLTVGRDESTREFRILSKYKIDDFYNIWKDFKSDMFDFKISQFSKEQRSFCYAGVWSYALDLHSGDLYPCHGCNSIDNIYKKPRKKLNEDAVGYRCPNAHCYNCHAYMTMGIFPDIETITYAATRNRVQLDGKEWLQDEVKDFFSQKFINNNDVKKTSIINLFKNK